MDHSLLLWINSHHSPFWDEVMFTASRATTWLPLYLVLIILLMIAYGPKRDEAMKSAGTFPPLRAWGPVLVAIIAVATSAGLADFVSSGIMKPIFCRPRPSHSELEPLLHFVNGYQGGHYGFPSSHAADTSAVAVSFLLLWRNAPCPNWGTQSNHTPCPFWGKGTTKSGERGLLGLGALLLYVAINIYSRMYLGVHYPSDILVGLFIGTLLAYLVTTLALRLIGKMVK